MFLRRFAESSKPEPDTMLLAIALVFAAASPAPAAEAPAPAANAGEEKICKRFNDTTGTRLAYKRVCKTAAEWQNDSDRIDSAKTLRGVKD